MKEEFILPEKFLKTNYEAWMSKARLDLKVDDVEKRLKTLSIEEIDFFPLQDHAEFHFTLKSFPENCLETRYLFATELKANALEGHHHLTSENSEDLDESVDSYALNSKDYNFSKNSFYRLQLETVEEFKKIDLKEGHILLDITNLHNAGGSIIQELASFIHLFLEVAKKEKTLLKRTRLLVSVDSHFFQNIAKIRALRFIAEKILSLENLSFDEFEIHGVSSLREQTVYDPWVNLLRNTTSSQASILGGVNFVSTFGEDQIFNFLGQGKSSLSEKLTRNIPMVLLEESLLSKVKDPGHGSFLIESLTSQMVEKSWERARLWKELSQERVKLISQEVKEVSDKRLLDIRKRNTVVTGVNNFANPEDKIFGVDLLAYEKSLTGLFPIRRNAREFESLRARLEKLERPLKGEVLVWKNESKLSARISFSQNYFELLGIPVTQGEVVQTSDSLNKALTKDFDFFIIVASDEDYASFAQNITSEKEIFLTGKKTNFGNFQNIFQGQDVYEVLEKLVLALEKVNA